MTLLQFFTYLIFPLTVIVYGCFIFWRYKHHVNDPTEKEKSIIPLFGFGKLSVSVERNRFLINLLFLPIFFMLVLSGAIYWGMGTDLRNTYGIETAAMFAFVITTVVVTLKVGYKLYKKPVRVERPRVVNNSNEDVIRAKENQINRLKNNLTSERNKYNSEVARLEREYKTKLADLENNSGEVDYNKEVEKLRAGYIEAKDKLTKRERELEDKEKELLKKSRMIESELKAEYQRKFEEAVEKNKEELLDGILLKSVESADSHDDLFELAKRNKSMETREEELQKEEYLEKLNQVKRSAEEINLKAEGKLLQADEKLLQAKHERFSAAEQFLLFKTLLLEQEKKILALDTGLKDQARDTKIDINNIENKFSLLSQKEDYEKKLLQSHLEQQIAKSEAQIKEEINETKNLIGEVKVQYGELKNKFGGEVLRMESDVNKVLRQLGSYINEVGKMGNVIERVKDKIDRQGWESQKILKEADLIEKRMENKVKEVSNQLLLSAEKFNLLEDKLGVKEGKLANTISGAALKLDKITNDQIYALKDIAYERMDVDFFAKGKKQEIIEIQRDMERLLEQISTSEAKMNFYFNEGDVGAAHKLKGEYLEHQREARKVHRRLAQQKYLVDFIEKDTYDDYEEMNW